MGVRLFHTASNQPKNNTKTKLDATRRHQWKVSCYTSFKPLWDTGYDQYTNWDPKQGPKMKGRQITRFFFLLSTYIHKIYTCASDRYICT